MLLLLSPAKTQNFDAVHQTDFAQKPHFQEEIKDLVGILKEKEEAELQKLMGISENLAQLNHERFQKFSPEFTKENAKQAILAFKGDVYTGLAADEFDHEDLLFAHEHLCMISGLYGCLKAMDLMQPYRLEMKTKLANEQGKDLYAFWGNKITDFLNQALEKHSSKFVVNLASNEYAKAVKWKDIKGEVLEIQFKEKKGDQYKVVAIYAKKARGMMANYAIKERLTSPEGLKDFDQEGYAFHEGLSDEKKWVFAR